MSELGNQSPAEDPVRARITVPTDKVARIWWAADLRGLPGILFGLGSILAPGAIVPSFALAFGAYLTVNGHRSPDLVARTGRRAVVPALNRTARQCAIDRVIGCETFVFIPANASSNL